ncbi:hypothetical protein ACI1US_01006 [Leucobacter sp. BZR 635]
MTDPTPEQVEAAAKAMGDASSGFFSEGSWRHLAREALIAAAGVTPQEPTGANEASRLAAEGWAIRNEFVKFWGKHSSNDLSRIGHSPKMPETPALDRWYPRDGSDGVAAGAAPQERQERFHIWSEVPCKPGRCRLAAPVQVDEAKLAEVIWGEQESRVLDGYVIHTRETAATTARAVAEHLRGGGQ